MNVNPEVAAVRQVVLSFLSYRRVGVIFENENHFLRNHFFHPESSEYWQRKLFFEFFFWGGGDEISIRPQG